MWASNCLLRLIIIKRPLLVFCLLAACSQAFPASAESAGKTFTPIDDLHSPLEKTDRSFVVIPGRDPNDWSFTIEPYLWTMAASGKVGVNGLPPVQIDYNAKTILQHLDWGIMGRGEARKGRWGILADGLFAQLSAAGDLPASLYTSSSIQLQQGMASLALAYRVIENRWGFLDIYAGARYNYMGININTTVDSEGIDTFSEAAAQRIVQVAGVQADAFLAQNREAIVSEVAGAVTNKLTTKALEKIAEFPGDLNRRDVIRIIRNIRANSGKYREMIAAVAQARVAAAKNQLTSAIENRVSQAEKKLAKALSRGIENKLPTSYDGSQWWVDPIMVGTAAVVEAGFRLRVCRAS